MTKPITPTAVLPVPKSAINWLIVSLAAAIGWHIAHIPSWAFVAAFLITGAAQASSDSEIVQMAEAYFKNSGFVYTLKPGLMDSDEPFEDFLFNKRKGFCEHFAGAFTLLMRAAQVPARLVVGYQGGVYNNVGNYLLVRQCEAHAWSEVWLEGKGWQRVDPTAWVSPERIVYGLEVSESLALGKLSGQSPEEALREALKENIFKKVGRFFRLHWDTINYKWDAWIIGYDRFQQIDILKHLGFKNIKGSELFFTVIIIVSFLFVLLSYILKRRNLSTDPVLKHYHVFCRKMEKNGIQRLRWEGPLHFGQRASERFPRKAEAIHRITAVFIDLRYSRSPVTKKQVIAFKRLIRKF
ncbi:MAG: DUF4129 domain-containing transglutaminase family protein [Candidatus Omnitrophota bacterium]